MKRIRGRGRPAHDDVLTPAEWRTLHAIQHGLSARQLARRIGVSTDAVKYHVENIRAKLDLSDTKALRRRLAIPKSSSLREEVMHNAKKLAVGKLAVGQIARTVSDVKASEQWYRDTLALPHLYTFGHLAFFDLNGVRLMLSQSGEVKDESIVYFRTSDILSLSEQLQSKGVEFLSAPHLIHTDTDGAEEWMAFFKDLEGRPLALMSRVASK